MPPRPYPYTMMSMHGPLAQILVPVSRETCYRTSGGAVDPLSVLGDSDDVLVYSSKIQPPPPTVYTTSTVDVPCKNNFFFSPVFPFGDYSTILTIAAAVFETTSSTNGKRGARAYASLVMTTKTNGSGAEGGRCREGTTGKVLRRVGRRTAEGALYSLYVIPEKSNNSYCLTLCTHAHTIQKTQGGIFENKMKRVDRICVYRR